MYIFRDSHRQTFLDKPMAATQSGLSAPKAALFQRDSTVDSLDTSTVSSSRQLQDFHDIWSRSGNFSYGHPAESIDIRTCWSYCNYGRIHDTSGSIHSCCKLLWSSGSIEMSTVCIPGRHFAPRSPKSMILSWPCDSTVIRAALRLWLACLWNSLGGEMWSIVKVKWDRRFSCFR